MPAFPSNHYKVLDGLVKAAVLFSAYGKQAIVWTVNTAQSMYRFLDSGVDAVITDEIRLAHETQQKLDARSDLQVIQDKLAGIWE